MTTSTLIIFEFIINVITIFAWPVAILVSILILKRDYKKILK
jgi:hypothetical protein